MERKFTDNEIVKALECCREKDCGDCQMIEYPQTICEWDVFDLAIDLINRQKAEIERLNHIRAELSKENDALKEEKDNLIKTYKECMTEAIKEFADRLKEGYAPSGDFGDPFVLTVTAKWIDNLVKEMIGEDNGN